MKSFWHHYGLMDSAKKYFRILMPISGAMLCVGFCANPLFAQNIQSKTAIYPLFETDNHTSQTTNFSYEKLLDALLVLNFEPVYLKSKNKVNVLKTGTLMKSLGPATHPDDISVELPDGRKGWVPRKSLIFYPSEGYLKKLQMHTRSTWNAFLEPLLSLATNPIRLGLGLKFSKVFFQDGFGGNKDGHIEMSVYGLSVIKVSEAKPRLGTVGLSAEYYFRMGLGGLLMMGPGVGWMKISGKHSYKKSSFPTASIKGRLMISPRLGIYGELMSYNLPKPQAMSLLGGMSLTF